MFNIYAYIEDLEAIGGWCNSLTAEAIYFIGKNQSVVGDVLEIGIHHGKSFIPIAATIKENERAIAIDIFEDQHLNIDNSGEGNRKIFEKNLLNYFSNLNNIKIIKQDSTKLTKNDFDNSIRLMSIDGGHTKGITYSDLVLANNIVDEKNGIVFLDDFLNPDWLGVLSGYLSYINDYPDSFIPIAYFPNKIILSRPYSSMQYKEQLFNNFSQSLSKCCVTFLNFEIDIYK